MIEDAEVSRLIAICRRNEVTVSSASKAQTWGSIADALEELLRIRPLARNAKIRMEGIVS